MPGLISDQLLRNLRVVANKQLVTPVIVRRRQKVENEYGTVEQDVVVGTFMAWYKPAFKGDLRIQPGGKIANDSGAEFRFDIDSDIRVGDRLEVDGEPGFIVQDTTQGATIQLYLKAWTQVIE
jgi:hypothetical protein